MLIEGISRYHGGEVLNAQYHKIAKRRGTNKARVALARKVLTLAYYGLRDGEIRCLAPGEKTAALDIPSFRGGIDYEEMPCPRSDGSSIRTSRTVRCASCWSRA